MSDDDEDIGLEPWAVGLRHDHAEFVREFLIDMNASQAMMRCGATQANARGNANKMIRRPNVARAIAAAMQERAEAMKISAQTVLGEAFRSYLACVEAREWAAAKGFLEMCGKHVDVNAFRIQVGISNPNGGPVQFEDVSKYSDEELDALEAARSIIDSKRGGDPGGEGAPGESEGG